MSAPLDATQRDALLTALDQIEGAVLPADRWTDLARLLDDTTEAVRTGDRTILDELVTELARAGFHAQVVRRLGGRRATAPVVVPARSSPALPVVGLVCAVGIGALGFALGGGILAAATVMLAIFVLAVALAGTHAANARRREAGARSTPTGGMVGAGADLIDRIGELRRLAA